MINLPQTWTDKDTGACDPLIKSWLYMPEHGDSPIGAVARYQGANGKNVVPFFRVNERGQFRAGAAPEPRPLFGLDTLSRPGPIWIVEGEKPAAALHYLGFAAVTSPGGGRAAEKADWGPIIRALKAGRALTIWPDNDAPGRAYAATVARLLGDGCGCLLIPPPGTPEEQGADSADWLTAALAAMGREWDGINPPDLSTDERSTLAGRLMDLDADTQGPPPPQWGGHDGTAKHNGTRPANDNEPAPYVAIDRGTFQLIVSDGGTKERKLANFTAFITEEVKRDDGQEQSLTITIEGALNGRALAPQTMTIEQFERLSWPVKGWGTACLINPGQGVKDQLKHAIQYLSHNRRGQQVSSRTVYTHTGWRKTPSGWVFLSAGSVIGAGGAVDGIDVDLGELGNLYCLPPPSRTPEERRAAAAASMEAATIAPPEVSIPLIACTYLAPLAQHLGVDFALWLEGPSRSMKSTLAAIMAAHFGQGIERTSLAASWLDTQNTIGFKLFMLADALAVVDDYAPQPTAGDQAKLDKAVHSVVRGIGNIAGRGRLTSDIRLQIERKPRSMTICTAEQWPTGESINARLFGVSIAPRSLDMGRLNRAQDAASNGTLARAMADHLSTCAGDFERYHNESREEWLKLRDIAMEAGLLGRTPDQAAHLLVGYTKALAHWRTTGAVTAETAKRMFLDAKEVIFDLSKTHGLRISSAQPADAFVRILADLLLSGGAYLMDMAGNRPAINADRYGWKNDLPEGPKIGWVNEPKQEVYLLPESALDAVMGRARRIDAPLNIRQKALFRQLVDRGVLAPGEQGYRDGKPSERTTRKVSIGNIRPRVWTMRLSVLNGNHEESEFDGFDHSD